MIKDLLGNQFLIGPKFNRHSRGLVMPQAVFAAASADSPLFKALK